MKLRFAWQQMCDGFKHNPDVIVNFLERNWDVLDIEPAEDGWYDVIIKIDETSYDLQITPNGLIETIDMIGAGVE